MLTDTEINACQQNGRDEAGRRTTIGLAELDALCEQAREANRLRRLVARLVVRADDVRPDQPRWWCETEPEGHRIKLASTVVLHLGAKPERSQFAIIDG